MSANTGVALTKIDKLREVLSSLLTEDVTGLPAATQMQCLQALRPAVCQIQALQLRLVGAVDANASARTQGSASTATWLRNTLHIPKATELVKSAAALSRLPIVAAAFEAGQINDAHVATIAKVAETVPPQALVEGVEELLVTQASQLTPSKFVPVAARIRDEAAPCPRPPLHRPPGRWLRADQRSDGRLRVRGMFDPDSGRVVLAALTGATASGSPGGPDEEANRADALVELCRRAVLVGEDAQTDRDASAPPPAAPGLTMAPSGERSTSRGGRVRRQTSSPPFDAPGRGPTTAGRPVQPVESDSAGIENPATVGEDSSAVDANQSKRAGRRSAKMRKSNRTQRRHKHHRSPNWT